MSDNVIEEAGGSGKCGLTDRTSMRGESDELFSKFSDGFVNGGVLVLILRTTEDEKDAHRFQGFVGSKA